MLLPDSTGQMSLPDSRGRKAETLKFQQGSNHMLITHIEMRDFGVLIDSCFISYQDFDILINLVVAIVLYLTKHLSKIDISLQTGIWLI